MVIMSVSESFPISSSFFVFFFWEKLTTYDATYQFGLSGFSATEVVRCGRVDTE